jgi:hypothetical protein
MQNNDIHYLYEYYTLTCIVLNYLKYIPFSYVEIICMFSTIRRTLYNTEFESFRQTKHDSYCLKIKYLATIHFINMKFHIYLIMKYDFQMVVSFEKRSLFSLDN